MTLETIITTYDIISAPSLVYDDESSLSLHWSSLFNEHFSTVSTLLSNNKQCINSCIYNEYIPSNVSRVCCL